MGGDYRATRPVPDAAVAPNIRRDPINTWTDAAAHGAVIAIDPATGERKWTFPMYDLTDSGILTTASDLLFTGGREGYFQALDARTGELLWKSSLGSVQIYRPDHLRGRRQAVRDDHLRQRARGVRAQGLSRIVSGGCLLRPYRRKGGGRMERNLLPGVGLTGCSRAGLRPAVE